MKKLKELRIANNFTMRLMGQKLGISAAHYCQIEHGKRTLSYQLAVKIATIFKLKPDDIFYQAFKKTS